MKLRLKNRKYYISSKADFILFSYDIHINNKFADMINIMVNDKNERYVFTYNLGFIGDDIYPDMRTEEIFLPNLKNKDANSKIIFLRKIANKSLVKYIRSRDLKEIYNYQL